MPNIKNENNNNDEMESIRSTKQGFSEISEDLYSNFSSEEGENKVNEKLREKRIQLQRPVKNNLLQTRYNEDSENNSATSMTSPTKTNNDKTEEVVVSPKSATEDIRELKTLS